MKTKSEIKKELELSTKLFLQSGNTITRVPSAKIKIQKSSVKETRKKPSSIQPTRVKSYLGLIYG